MTTHVNDAGTWRQLLGVYVNDVGTWREIREVYVNDAGTWRSVYVGETVSLPALIIALRSNGGSPATFSLNSTGTYTGDGLSATDWVTPTSAAANYECRLTVNSGSLTSGTAGAWLPLSVTQTWTRGAALAADQIVDCTLEIRRASDGVVQDTAHLVIECDRT